MFSTQEVDQSKFIIVAAPIGDGSRAQLNIYEQRGAQRPCYAVSGSRPAVVDPLLASFDFTGICNRFIDGNGYSLRIGTSDLGTVYRLSVVKDSAETLLMAQPTRADAGPEMVVARTGGQGNGFLLLVPEPGWPVMRRSFGNRALGHVYVYRDSWPGEATATKGSPGPVAPTAQLPVEPKLPAGQSAPARAPGPCRGAEAGGRCQAQLRRCDRFQPQFGARRRRHAKPGSWCQPRRPCKPKPGAQPGTARKPGPGSSTPARRCREFQAFGVGQGPCPEPNLVGPPRLPIQLRLLIQSRLRHPVRLLDQTRLWQQKAVAAEKAVAPAKSAAPSRAATPVQAVEPAKAAASTKTVEPAKATKPLAVAPKPTAPAPLAVAPNLPALPAATSAPAASAH
jgi:hypothetical protein